MLQIRDIFDDNSKTVSINLDGFCKFAAKIDMITYWNHLGEAVLIMSQHMLSIEIKISFQTYLLIWSLKAQDLFLLCQN